jgi:DNA polymerase-3 subunit beta
MLSQNNKILEVTTTNLTEFFYTEASVEGAGESSVVIDIKKVVEFLAFLKPGQIRVFLEKNSLIIEAGKTRGVFGTMPKEDFPKRPQIEGKELVLDKAFIKNKLPLVLFAAAHDEARPILTGVHFTTINSEGYVVSTDGFRLSLIKEKGMNSLPNMNVSSGMLAEIVKFSDKGDVVFYFSETDKMIRAVVGDVEIYSRFIEGEFPAFERVVPESYKSRVVVRRVEFLRNMKLVSVFAKDVSNTVVFEVTKEGIKIQPKTSDADSARIFQEVESFEGEDRKIAFNYRFLVDFLNNTTSEKIIFEMTENTAPGVFKLENAENFLHIIMPIRTEE